MSAHVSSLCRVVDSQNEPQSQDIWAIVGGFFSSMFAGGATYSFDSPFAAGGAAFVIGEAVGRGVDSIAPKQTRTKLDVYAFPTNQSELIHG